MSDDVNNIDRSRAAMRRRIDELNRSHARSAQELNKILKEMTKCARLEIRLGIAAAILKCFENLVLETPVDTGRLRAGWRIGASGPNTLPAKGTYPQFQDNDVAKAAIRAVASLDEGTVLSEADTLWIYDKVEYVLALNAGWSKKQAGGFIDRFLADLKRELERIARE